MPKNPTLGERILTLLVDKPLTAQDIATTLSVRIEAVRPTVTKLKKSGKIVEGAAIASVKGRPAHTLALAPAIASPAPTVPAPTTTAPTTDATN